MDVARLRGNKLPVKFVEKSSDKYVLFVNFFMEAMGNYDFMRYSWTAYRFPFERHVTVVHPDGIDPSETRFEGAVEHEMYHARYIETAWGLVKAYVLSFFPLPIIFSGRWFLEREAYLINIKRGDYTIDEVVRLLWENYGYCWPRFLMRGWYLKRLEED